MMLHLVFQAVLDEAVVARIAPGDAVVIIENAVLMTLKTGSAHNLLTRLLANNRVYVISEQLVVRGIHANELVTGIGVIDYAGLADLSVACSVIQSWA